MKIYITEDMNKYSKEVYSTPTTERKNLRVAGLDAEQAMWSVTGKPWVPSYGPVDFTHRGKDIQFKSRMKDPRKCMFLVSNKQYIDPSITHFVFAEVEYYKDPKGNKIGEVHPILDKKEKVQLFPKAYIERYMKKHIQNVEAMYIQEKFLRNYHAYK